MKLIGISEMDHLPKHSYIIIDDCVMEFEYSELIDSFEGSGDTIEEIAQNFINENEDKFEHKPKKIYFDDTGMYSAMVIEDMGYFTDDPFEGADEEEIEDWESFAEYYSEH